MRIERRDRRTLRSRSVQSPPTRGCLRRSDGFHRCASTCGDEEHEETRAHHRTFAHELTRDGRRRVRRDEHDDAFVEWQEPIALRFERAPNRFRIGACRSAKNLQSHSNRPFAQLTRAVCRTLHRERSIRQCGRESSIEIVLCGRRDVLKIGEGRSRSQRGLIARCDSAWPSR